MTICEVSGLETIGCAHCRPKKSYSFEARFPGTCVTCEGDILVGEFIRETVTGDYEHSRHR